MKFLVRVFKSEKAVTGERLGKVSPMQRFYIQSDSMDDAKKHVMKRFSRVSRVLRSINFQGKDKIVVYLGEPK
jgi:hypothetical protein